ncbi:MAG TPA: DHA2 family efflux MFS transporter permease subunit [Spirochaetia bacterium]|nr:DHA2 family efflux MFS transporter permease subunit [Spirochaetia bacterium]
MADAALKAPADDGLDHKHWLVPVLVTLIGVFMSILDSSIVNVAISSIMTVFNTDTAGVEWVSTAYMLAMGIVVPMSGWLGEKLGLKQLYLACLVAFTIGSVLCAAAWSLESLIFARILQALGGGMLMPTVMAMVYKLVPRDKMGAGMGIFGMALIFAPAIGPTLGGWLVEYVDWRWIFTINLPVGIVGVLLGFFFIPEFKHDGHLGKFDIPGALTAGVGFAGLLYVLSKGNEWGWSSEATILTLVGSIGILVIFVLIELWSPSPLLDLKVFLYPAFTFANIAVVITTIGMFAGLFYIPLFLQSIRGLGAMETGMLMLPGALASGLLMPISGQLYDRFGPKVVMALGLLLMATMTLMFGTITLDTSLLTIILWNVGRGAAMGLSMMPAQTAAMADMPAHLISRASSVTSIIRNIASSFGIAVMTVLLQNRNTFHHARMSDALSPDNTAYTDWLTSTPGIGTTLMGTQMAKQSFVSAIQDVFLLTAAFTLLALIPAFFLKKAEKKPQAGGNAPAAVME